MALRGSAVRVRLTPFIESLIRSSNIQQMPVSKGVQAYLLCSKVQESLLLSTSIWGYELGYIYLPKEVYPHAE